MSGDIGQTVKQDFGDFVEIGGFRIRKELIVCYHVLDELSGDPFGRKHGVGIKTTHCGLGIPVASREEAETLVTRLDWIFAKDSNGK